MTANSVLVTVGDIPLNLLLLITGLVLVIGLASMILQRLRFPFTIGLVLIGLLLSAFGDYWHLPLLPRVHLTENMILYVFLPALIFDAALSLDVKEMVRNLVPILVLAVPGVVFATLATAALVHWLTPLEWGPALLFGALISTTDPVAVIATFKDLKAPERLTMLVDGESLFNDATAIVLFGIVAGLVAQGGTPDSATYVTAALQFLWVFCGGFVVGVIIGYVAAMLIHLSHWSGHVTLGILFSICAAYSSFLVGQGILGLSGVMATVGAGMVIATMTKKNADSEVNQQMRSFWPVASFFGNSLIFLFLGLTERYLLDRNLLQSAGAYMLAAALIVLFIRILLVYGFVPVSNLLPGSEKVPSNYKPVMVWGGLRGALPIGLAVSIKPEALGLEDMFLAQNQYRYIILFTVAVVVFTLVVQGVTIGGLMQRMGLTAGDAPEEPVVKKRRAATKKA